MVTPEDKELAEHLIDLLPNHQLNYIQWYLEGIPFSYSTSSYNSFFIKALAQVLSKKSAEKVWPRVLQHLRKVKADVHTHCICEEWASSRNPMLEALIVENQWISLITPKLKVLTALKNDKLHFLTYLENDELRALATASKDRDKEIAERANFVLQDLPLHYLKKLASTITKTNRPHVIDVLAKRNYIPDTPLKARILVALQLRKSEIILDEGAEIVPHLIETCLSTNKAIALCAQQLLPQLTNPDAQEALCNTVIREEIPFVQAVVLEKGWLPSQIHRQALFYFVTEQWDKYEVLDFDGRMLRTAYAVADPVLRRRLAAKVRASGRTEYLAVIAGGDSRSRMAEVTAEEAEIMVQMLVESQNWAELWALVPLLPLKWSAEAVKILAKASWFPENEAAHAILEQLIPLAHSQMLLEESEVTPYLPLAVERAQATLPGKKPGRLNAVAFSPNRPLLAIATATGKIALWNMQNATLERIIVGTNNRRSIGQVIFTPENRLVWAERNNSSTATCNIYFWQDETVVHLGENVGSITALKAVGNHMVISAGRDGRVILWDLRTKEVLQIYSVCNTQHLYEDWARNLCVSADGQRVAVFHETVTILSLPDFQVISHNSFDDFGIVPKAAFAPDDQSLVITKAESFLRFALTDGEGGLNPKLEVLRHTTKQDKGNLPGVATLKNASVIISTGSRGQTDFVDWETCQLLGQLQASGYAVATSIDISPDEAFLAVCDHNATIRLWDLRVLALRRLFSRPLAVAGLSHLAAIDLLREEKKELSAPLETALNFIEVLLRGHRFRYDIELGDVALIQPGIYDIEIEE